MFSDIVDTPTSIEVKTGDYIDGKSVYTTFSAFYAVMSASADDINFFGSTDFKTVVLIISDNDIPIGAKVLIDGVKFEVSKVKVCKDFNKRIIGYRCYFV